MWQKLELYLFVLTFWHCFHPWILGDQETAIREGAQTLSKVTRLNYAINQNSSQSAQSLFNKSRPYKSDSALLLVLFTIITGRKYTTNTTLVIEFTNCSCSCSTLNTETDRRIHGTWN